MKFTIDDNEITLGEGAYPLSGLRSWKVWLADSGKPMAMLRPAQGDAVVSEVEFSPTFKDTSGMPVEVDYWIISWASGLGKPSCTVRSGGKHMAAEWEVPKPKGKRGFKVIPGFHEGKYDSDGNDLPEEEDDGA